MFQYLMNRWGENTTNWGLVGVVFAFILLVASFFVSYDVSQIMRDVGKPVMAAGLIAIIIPDRKSK